MARCLTHFAVAASILFFPLSAADAASAAALANPLPYPLARADRIITRPVSGTFSKSRFRSGRSKSFGRSKFYGRQSREGDVDGEVKSEENDDGRHEDAEANGRSKGEEQENTGRLSGQVEGEASEGNFVDGARQAVTHNVRSASRDLASIPGRVSSAGQGASEMEEVAMAIEHAFLKDVHLTREVLLGTCLAASAGIAWFFVWFMMLFDSDRVDRLAEEDTDDNIAVAEGDEEGEEEDEVTCDFSLSSPRMPSFDDWVNEATPGRGMCAVGEKDGKYSRINPDLVLVFCHPKCIGSDSDTEIPKRHIEELFESQQEDWANSLSRLHELTIRPASQPVTIGEARFALMKDTRDLLEHMDFDVYTFASIDDSEVYICATLGKPDALYGYCHAENIPVQLSTNIAEKLGVDLPSVQVEPASSPPGLQLDRRLIGRLQKSGVQVGMDDLYDLTQLAPGSAIRVRIIYQELTRHLNTKRAQSLGLIRDWFPSHHRGTLSQLRRNWSMQMRLKQPLNLLNCYFGERLTFILAWQGHYTKLLLALFVPALAAMGATALSKRYGLYERTVHSVVHLAFSFVVVLWGALAQRLWEREQDFLEEMWNCQDNEEHQIVRPDFVGTWQPSVVDRNMQDKETPARAFALRKAVSGLVTLACVCCVVVFVNFWFSLWRGDLGTTAALLLGVQMKLFEMLFNKIAEALTQWENHKFQSGHYNSYVIKLFAFNFVNYYYAFIHVLFLQEYSPAGCPEGGCLHMVKDKLIDVYFFLVVVSMLKAILVDWRVKLHQEYEAYNMRSRNAMEQVERLTLLEKQTMFGEFKEPEQCDMMVQLVVSLGFVLLFGAFVPAVVLLSGFIFAFHLRMVSILLTTCVQRTFPWNLSGIGSWNHAINGMWMLGVLFNASVLVMNEEGIFGAMPLATKLAVFLIFVLLSLATRVVLGLVLDCPDAQSRLMILRRKHVVQTLNRLVLQQDKLDRDTSLPFVQTTTRAHWTNIRHFRQPSSSQSRSERSVSLSHKGDGER